MVNWLTTRINQIAIVLSERYGLTNITYETTPNKVIFFENGYYFGCFEGKKLINTFYY